MESLALVRRLAYFWLEVLVDIGSSYSAWCVSVAESKKTGSTVNVRATVDCLEDEIANTENTATVWREFVGTVVVNVADVALAFPAVFVAVTLFLAIGESALT